MTNYKKTVLITGASRGIGRACAVELARTGHALVLNSRRPSAEMDETVRLCEEAGAEVRTLFFDVGSTEAARTAIEADIAANGAYWGVVLNAGVTCDNAFPALEDLKTVESTLSQIRRRRARGTSGLWPSSP